MALPPAALLCQVCHHRQTHLLLAALEASGEEHHVNKARMVAKGSQQKLSRSAVLPRVRADPFIHPECVQQGTSHALQAFTACTDMPSPCKGEARACKWFPELGTATTGLNYIIFDEGFSQCGQECPCLA